MKKIIAIAFLSANILFFAVQAHPPTQPYTVQIGTYKNLPSTLISTVGSFGKVHTTQVGELTRITVGNYASRKQAQDTLEQLKQAGHEDAFISRLSSGGDHHAGHSEDPSEMEKLYKLSEQDKQRAVLLDGKLYFKDGAEFTPVP